MIISPTDYNYNQCISLALTLMYIFLFFFQVHVLPREIMGVSTFGLSLWLLTHLSIQKVDQILLVLTQLVLGDTARLGIPRPNIGPMELKRVSGKTPVLDVGTIAKIKSGDIKVINLFFHLDIVVVI